MNLRNATLALMSSILTFTKINKSLAYEQIGFCRVPQEGDGNDEGLWSM